MLYYIGNRKMEVLVCPQCGSKDFYQTTIQDEVATDSSKKWECSCKECGYRGIPIILDKYEGTFQGSQPSNPGFIGPWIIRTRLDSGEEKVLEVLWEDAQDCIQALQLKRGDKIRVTLDQKVWCIERLHE